MAKKAKRSAKKTSGAGSKVTPANRKRAMPRKAKAPKKTRMKAAPTVRSRHTSSAKSRTKKSLLSKGGGNATAAGVTFQASVGAIFVAQLLAERTLDSRFALGGAKPKSIRFESEAPLDDIAIETDANGWLLIQAKNTLTLSTSIKSDLGKTAEQIVSQWHASLGGTGKRGWDRPLDIARDRFVVAVGPNASGTITNDLTRALVAIRASHNAPLPAYQRAALRCLTELLKAAWLRVTGAKAMASDIQNLLPLISVVRFDVIGPDRNTAVEVMAHLTERQADAPIALLALERECQTLMSGRLGADAAAFRASLAQAGVGLKAAPSYQADIESLKKYSESTKALLKDYETISVDGKRISISRKSADAIAAAAIGDSLLIIGESGAGKSAVVNAAAATLSAVKHDVVQLAVDRLQVDTDEGLRSALSLVHPLLSVLENWPGTKPAFLFIDALDATRGGRGEAVFRNLIAEVMALPSKRWRIVASIRSFDLRLGERFRELFRGKPASTVFADPSFSDVRHINIPRWSPEELAELLAKAPRLATAIEAGGDKLRDLALVPFNTRLLADLISGGTSADAFGLIGSQVELLSLYWRKRVGIASGTQHCLRVLVAEMVKGRTLQASKMIGASADATALDQLLRDNVLFSIAADRFVVFRHHILFDYAASRVFIDPADISATAALLRSERDLALMLAPALSYALQELWMTGTDGHPEFWKAAVTLAGDSGSHPIARSVAARMACELPRATSDMRGLAALFGKPSNQEVAFKAFSHIVGALHVRFEEKTSISCGPWCFLAEQASRCIDKTVWPLRSLVALVLKHTADTSERKLAGEAARIVLSYCLTTTTSARQLVPIGIELVAETYGTDLGKSRSILSELIKPERLAENAHQDVPALARQWKLLRDSDPEFLIDIYRVAFGYKVTDTAPTSLGQSRIMPLTSTKKQDGARFQMREAFPSFLEKHPEQAVRALVAALEGYVESNHKTAAPERHLDVNGKPCVLREDMSHIWASDPEDRYAYANDMASIILAFKSRLESAKNDEALELVSFVAEYNKLAVLWARVFLVAAKRPDVLGLAVWPYASAVPFLRAAETRKDAVDAVAAAYPLLDPAARASFEESIACVVFENVENPNKTKLRFLGTVFQTIGAAKLATDAAKQVVRDTEAAKLSSENRRVRTADVQWRAPEPYWFLEDKGVDVSAPENIELLQLVKELEELISPNSEVPVDVVKAAERLRVLEQALVSASASGASQQVIEYAEDSLVQRCAYLARQKAGLAESQPSIATLRDIVKKYVVHPRPQGGTETSTGPRAYAVEAAFQCAR